MWALDVRPSGNRFFQHNNGAILAPLVACPGDERLRAMVVVQLPALPLARVVCIVICSAENIHSFTSAIVCTSCFVTYLSYSRVSLQSDHIAKNRCFTGYASADGRDPNDSALHVYLSNG